MSSSNPTRVYLILRLSKYRRLKAIFQKNLELKDRIVAFSFLNQDSFSNDVTFSKTPFWLFSKLPIQQGMEV